MKYRILIIVILFGPFIYIASCNRNTKAAKATTFKFPLKLSDFHLFKGKMNNLKPAADLQLLELSSTLFTDYAEKQRLIKIPKGKKMVINGDGLPVFPEGTILVKTFYYPKDKTQSKANHQLMETRLLILKQGKWNAGTYQWNKNQDEAIYTTEGTTVNVAWRDLNGATRKVAYHIPGQKECVSCHQHNEELMPIGPKVMNLNRIVTRSNQQVNQLTDLQQKGLVDLQINLAKLTALPAYENANINLDYRARAYMEINCAHCHNPAGLAYRQSLMLNYTNPYPHTGIDFNKRNIIERMETLGEFHMPKLGTTVLDKEGIKLIKDYLKNISK